MAAKQTLNNKTGKRAGGAKVGKKKRSDFTAYALGHGRRAMVLAAEIFALVAAALIAVIALLGKAAERFAGVELWSCLVPFAGVVLLLALTLFLWLRLWLFLRELLADRVSYLPAVLAAVVAAGAGGFAAGGEFRQELRSLRGLVGGAKEAERITLSHQVYAAYRRADLGQMQLLAERARPYESLIQKAAEVYDVDAEVLMGVGAAESSFLPRDSKDGGRGLFQLTAPPKAAVEKVAVRLGGSTLDWRNPRHNAMIAAATWRHYLKEMKGDLFLGLLAYNIGPKNGGLISIMRQYGAKDFATIQPYLQNLPRDYPIRVLTAALALRIWRVEGRLPRYEEGDNARRIQAIGIPGLSGTG